MIEGNPTAKVAKRVEDSLWKISHGIQNNQGFTVEHYLMFIYDLLMDAIPQLTVNRNL